MLISTLIQAKLKIIFSIVRSKDELIFMMGCLFINSNKIVYVSEHKNSVSKNLWALMNSDSANKQTRFTHIKMKELLKQTGRTVYARLIQKYIPKSIDLTNKSMII